MGNSKDSLSLYELPKLINSLTKTPEIVEPSE